MGQRQVFSMIVVLLVAMAWLTPAATAAPQNDGAACRQEVREWVISQSSEGTIGDYNSDVLMGNEPNPTTVDSDLDMGPDEINAENGPGSVAGQVLPSESPGPQTQGGGSFGPSDAQEIIRAICGN